LMMASAQRRQTPQTPSPSANESESAVFLFLNQRVIRRRCIE
jgi:hypothetical protein